MTDPRQKRDQVLKYFKTFSVFNAKDFDNAFLNASSYAIDNGFGEEELKLIATVAFKQKLASRRVVNLMKTLIPRTRVSEDVTRIVLEWLIVNHSEKIGKEALKSIFQWLIGLIEYELTDTKIINNNYEVFFRFLEYDDPQAAKLVYLLTKPSDVNRWYAKQLLKIHRIYESKSVGVLLYLFKTYRPDCVPENIPAYAAQTVFGKLPAALEAGFSKAKERIQEMNNIPTSVENIMWNREQTTYKSKVNDIILVPRMPVINNEFGINSAGYKSLMNVTNVKELQEYMLSTSTLDCTCLMSLLNNSAGRHVLSFSDIAVHTRLSFSLYHTLYDALIQHNPHIKYDEKEYLLKCLSLFQIHIQQGIPVVSKLLANYITSWDGYDHVDSISQLLQFITFTSYQELYDCILSYLKTIFLTGTVKMKCNILKILGNLIVNIIFTYTFKKETEAESMLPELEDEIDFSDVIHNIYKFTQKLCVIGSGLENNHCALDNSIAHLHDKILSSEAVASISIWQILPSLSYSALFVTSPTLICRICYLFMRFPKSVDKSIVNDYIHCLYNNESKIDDESYFSEISAVESEFMAKVGVNTSQLHIKRHIAFSYCNIKDELKHDPKSSSQNSFYHLKEVLLFLSYFITNKHPKKKNPNKRRKKM